MSQCVPSWDLDENPTYPHLSHRSRSNSTAPLDYEVAELTWENGQLAMHGLGPPRVPAKPVATASTTKYNWEKPRASGTLESLVNQATNLPQQRNKQPPFETATINEEIAPWFNQHHRAPVATAADTMTMDALVPCSNRSTERTTTTHVMDAAPKLGGTCVMDCSTRVGSCSGPAATQDEDHQVLLKRARVARVPVAHEWSSRDQSVSGSATFGRDSQHVTHDSYDMDIGADLTSTSMGSPENTSSAKPCTKATTADDHDSVCHSAPQREAGDEGEKNKGIGKSSVSTKRSRAAAIHNQSERKRRDKINQRMKTLQKLVPNSSKTDKASMLDEVIEYLKQLQAQVQMMGRMNMSPMMLPMAMQQQLQMSMMAPMGMGTGIGMGMGMGMGVGVMDINTMNRPNISGMPSVLTNPFMPVTSWDASAAQPAVMTDPLSTFLACQPQPMTMDAYSRMAAMYQQLQQPPASNSKSKE
ncbi:transcription factor UNE10-like isoform X2 [Mangifera indica]|uniref:transcription factor UNE10-like isoform X2 n=1 Tax=Mangifera indica TaxID=29780 RepID=UPI001CFB39C9|nr:transcription factor UNE10-like isoform X2 [Mangifera indica]